jgi:hypothetical protein
MSPWRTRLYALGSGAITLTGIGHLVVTAVLAMRQPSVQEQVVQRAMMTVAAPAPLIRRTYFDLFQGFSLTLGAFLLFFGALNLLLARLWSRQGVAVPSAVLLLDLVAMAAGLVLAGVFLPIFPLPLFAIAAACFAAALRAPAVTG